MKRNWDTVRALLIAVESITDEHAVLNSQQVSGVDAVTATYHLRLMIEAGLVDGRCLPDACIASRMTWAGHELLDAIRRDGVWQQIKTVARDSSVDLSLDLVKQIAIRVVGGMI